MSASVTPASEVHRIELDSGRTAIIHRFAAQGAARGAVAFSHGNESTPDSYRRVIAPWQAAGYEVWAPLHVDSRDHPMRDDYPGLATWRCRIEDMRAVAGLVGGPYAAAGHSYGALTALVLGGAQGEPPTDVAGDLFDPDVRCVVALSPPPVIPGLMPANGYAGLAVPALIQTGDGDLMPGWPEMDEGWRVHLEAYEQAAPGGGRYLAFLEGVDHYFGNAICEPTRDAAPQLAQLASTVELTTLFLRSFSPADDAQARQSLDARLTDRGPVQLTVK